MSGIPYLPGEWHLITSVLILFIYLLYSYNSFNSYFFCAADSLSYHISILLLVAIKLPTIQVQMKSFATHVLSLSRWNPLILTFIKTKNSNLNSTVIAEVYISWSRYILCEQFFTFIFNITMLWLSRIAYFVYDLTFAAAGSRK